MSEVHRNSRIDQLVDWNRRHMRAIELGRIGMIEVITSHLRTTGPQRISEITGFFEHEYTEGSVMRGVFRGRDMGVILYRDLYEEGLPVGRVYYVDDDGGGGIHTTSDVPLVGESL